MEKIQELITSDNWTIINDRKILHYNNQFYIITPLEFEKGDTCCEICNEIIKTSEDVESIKKYNCCDLCAMKWAHPRRKMWENGWRPSQEEISLEIAQRVWEIEI